MRKRTGILLGVVLLAVVSWVAMTRLAPGAALRIRWHFAYDDAGRLNKVVDPAGRETRLHHTLDTHGRVQQVTRTLSDGSRVTEEMDRFGSRVSMQDTLGTVHYDYDGFHRPITVRRTGSPDLTYTYDTQDRLNTVRVGETMLMRYIYDFLGRLSTIETPVGSITYEYRTGQGQIVRTLPNGVRTVWEFHVDDALAAITHVAKDDHVLLHFTYAYRPDGLIQTCTAWSPHGAKTSTYTYDQVQRLVTVEDSQLGQTSYSYTPLGDRLAVVAPSAAAVANTYDWASRLVHHAAQACTHDAAGNLSACRAEKAARTLTYNASNQLASAASAQGQVQYQYDGDGVLVARTVDGRTTSYVSDPLVQAWHPLVAIEEHSSPTYFVWDGATVIASITGEDVRFFLHDHLGSVRGETGRAGTLTGQFDYEAFGQPHQPVPIPQLLPGFAGLFYDPQAAVYLTRARVYDPMLGRFLQMDPEVRVPRGSQNDLSPYVYAGNDPVNFVDTSGRDRVPVNPGTLDWAAALRTWEQHAQMEMRQQLVQDLNTTVRTMTDALIDKTFTDQTLLQQLAHDLVNTARQTPPGESLDLSRIFINRLRQEMEGHIRDLLDTYLKPKFGPDTAFHGGERPQQSSYTLPEVPAHARSPQEAWNVTRDALKDLILKYLETAVKPHTGKLAVFDALRKDLRTYTYTQALGDMHTVFSAFEKNRQELAQLLSRRLTPLSSRALPMPSLASQTLRVSTGVFTSVMDGLQTGAKAVDIIGHAMQAMNAPVNLQQRQPWGWEGHTQRELWDGGTYRRDTLLLPFDDARLPRLRGSITRFDRQTVATDYGTMERRVLSSTPATSPAERFMMSRYPVQDYFDPQSTQSITMTRSHLHYQETTRDGVRTVTPLPHQEPLSPSNVGGVYLRGAGDALARLGPLAGIALDAQNGGLVLLGADAQHIDLPPLRLDDVVTIFRAVYLQGRAVSVSIDPDAENPQGPLMHVRLAPDLVKDTYVAWILFEADRLLKSYTLGRDNVTGAVVHSQVPCYRHLLDPALLGGNANDHASIWERFWIVPAAVHRQQTSDRHLTLFDVPLKVNTQRMEMRHGKLVPAANPQPSLGAKTVAAWFTSQYDAIAQEALAMPPQASGIATPVAVLTELRRIALITAIAETLRDQGVPFPAWMRDYQVKPVPVTPTTPSLVVTSASPPATTVDPRCAPGASRQPSWQARIYGGVNLGAAPQDIHTTPADPQAEALAPKLVQAVETTPMLSPVRVQHEETSYQAIALPGNATRALGGQYLEETDLTVSVQRSSQIALVRRFHSFAQPTDIFGGSWTLDLPQLEAQLQPVEHTEQTVQYRVGYQLTSALNTWSAHFVKRQYVPELNGEFLVPDHAAEMLALVGDHDARIGQHTRVILFRDGRRWHFDEAGRHVAWSAAPLLVVYRRDEAGRIQRIEGWYGAHRRADIALTYDSYGRLVAATGSDGTQVTYGYNEAGVLTHVAHPHGTVGYTSQQGLVTAVDRDGRTVETFAYTARGELQQRWSADGSTVDYAVKTQAQGLAMTATHHGPAPSVEAAMYDAALRPVHRTLADGTRMEWRRDHGAVEIAITGPDGLEYLLTHTADGRHREVRLPSGGVYALTLDASGRMTSIQQNGLPVLRQEWHRDGQLAALTFATVTVHPEYRTDGVMTGLVVAAPEQGAPLRWWRHLAYDEQGRVTEVSDYAGTRLQIGYDHTGEPAAITSTRGEITVTRDDRGALTAVATSWGTGQTYTRSPDGALTGIQLVEGTHAAVLALDQGSLTQVRQFDGGTYTLSYHREGRRSSQLQEIRTPHDDLLRYGYDAAHRLTHVDIGDTYRVAYRYDHRDRLIEVTRRPIR